MSKKLTQGRTLIEALRRRPMTYMDMLAVGVSVCPWKRVCECLAPDEELVKGRKHLGGSEYLTTWQVKRA